MNKSYWNYNTNPNISINDIYARYVIGALMIAVIFVPTTATVGWLVLFPLLAIPIIISAIMHWDPVYALFQKRPNNVVQGDNKSVAASQDRQTPQKDTEPHVTIPKAA